MILSEHFRYMQMAMDKAREGIENGQTPFAACIVKDGRVISCEHNRVWGMTDITAHAEICAIRMACLALGTIDLSGCVIYSTCEPCPMCFSACHWARIRKIFYGANIDDAQKAGFHELSISNYEMKQLGQSRIEIASDFLREENIKVFETWLKRKDHKAY